MTTETWDFFDLLIDRSLSYVEIRCINFGEFLEQFKHIDGKGWTLKNRGNHFFSIKDLYKIHTGKEN